MSKDDNDLKQMAIQWLRDGDDYPASLLLERCDLQVQYIDDAYELFGDTITTIVDIEAFSTRRDLALIESEKGEPKKRILAALRAVIGPGHHIRRMNWHGKINLRRQPIDEPVIMKLGAINSAQVPETWEKALDRRARDPEGAITLARILLEMTCKHILEEEGIEYKNADNLPKLYRLVAEELNLAPITQS